MKRAGQVAELMFWTLAAGVAGWAVLVTVDELRHKDTAAPSSGCGCGCSGSKAPTTTTAPSTTAQGITVGEPIPTVASPSTALAFFDPSAQ